MCEDDEGLSFSEGWFFMAVNQKVGVLRCWTVLTDRVQTEGRAIDNLSPCSLMDVIDWASHTQEFQKLLHVFKDFTLTLC